ncbi:FHA domain-containing protein [Merismopedia glauca]|uniref:Phosphopeptide-binding protein n=1 Tax=Merismopedia glauca CCAP 1448/3 TaxID=1296344 RepID=A0A2T1C8X5_9CYAN|nr:FHA domain-containing protein [Merismopedia glauca]PSB04720.1 phosphopeptide-binding protein [Merismopedia glauca CCAP 1448/3]
MSSENPHKHLLIIEDDTGRREFTVSNNLCSLGRQATSDVRLFSRFASRHHATLLRRLRDDGTDFYLIIDGDLTGKRSTNGILVNGRKLEVHELIDGDRIVFGPGVSIIYYLINLERKIREGNLDPAATTDGWDSGKLTPHHTPVPDETLHRTF